MHIHTQQGVFIKIKGWIVAEDGTSPQIVIENPERTVVKTSISRPDVVLVHNNANSCCGFEFFVETGRDVRIGAIIEDETLWFAKITFETLGVLKGYDDYLFLDNDSNNSVSQYNGELLIDDSNLHKWHVYFDKLESMRSKNDCKMLFLIAPGKEFIFPDKYPVARSSLSTLDQFLCEFRNDIILNPIKELTLERNQTYSKTDTHWTHFGAKVAAELVCNKFKIHFNEGASKYRFSQTTGDLGSKLHPVQTERLPVLDSTPTDDCRIFDNRIGNRGRIHVYDNPSAPTQETCMIFGDSFSTTLAPQLVNSFRRLIHVFSGADIDWSIVEFEKPHYLIAEITTRFFIKAPSPSFSILTELSRKYSMMSISKQQSEHERLKTHPNPSVSYYVNLCSSAIPPSS